jgi:hypothetical protein
MHDQTNGHQFLQVIKVAATQYHGSHWQAQQPNGPNPEAQGGPV